MRHKKTIDDGQRRSRSSLAAVSLATVLTRAAAPGGSLVPSTIRREFGQSNGERFVVTHRHRHPLLGGARAFMHLMKS
jgi:hypothetical protein